MVSVVVVMGAAAAASGAEVVVPLLCTPAGLSEPSEPGTGPKVSDPVVEGPIPNGIGSRSGRPFGTTLIPLPHGWIEQEFFISGTAHSAPLGGGTAAPYKTRILVRRPANLKAFNGTALLEWNNVSTGMDHDATWQDFAPTVYKHKFAFVGVAAQ